MKLRLTFCSSGHGAVLLRHACEVTAVSLQCPSRTGLLGSCPPSTIVLRVMKRAGRRWHLMVQLYPCAPNGAASGAAPPSLT